MSDTTPFFGKEGKLKVDRFLGRGIQNQFPKETPNQSELWSEKYRPHTIDDLIISRDQLNKIEEWFDEYRRGQVTRRALLFSGSPGTGKTSLSHILLRSHGYQVREYNASDVRSKKQVHDNLYKLIYMSSVDRVFQHEVLPFGIIMDEVDGMSAGDKGGMAELIHFINPNRGTRTRTTVKGSLPPIICICNASYDKKINELKKDCVEVVFKKPTEAQLQILLDRIRVREGMQIEEEAQRLLIRYAQEDFRRLACYMQHMYSVMSNQLITVKSVEANYLLVCQKEQDLNIYESTQNLFRVHRSIAETYRIYECDKSKLPMMVHENYLDQINNQDGNVFDKLETLEECIYSIIDGDIIDKTMYNNQSWYLQPVHGLNSCYIPSHYICRRPKRTEAKPRFTVALGKNSLQCSNRTTIQEIGTLISYTNTYHVTDIQIFSRIVLQLLIHSNTEVDQLAGCEMLKRYHLGIEKLEKLIKMNRLDNCKTLYTSRLKTHLKKLYGDINSAEYEKAIKVFGQSNGVIPRSSDDDDSIVPVSKEPTTRTKSVPSKTRKAEPRKAEPKKAETKKALTVESRKAPTVEPRKVLKKVNIKLQKKANPIPVLPKIKLTLRKI